MDEETRIDRMKKKLPVSTLDFLESVALNDDYPIAMRMEAAIATLPYSHPKLLVQAADEPV